MDKNELKRRYEEIKEKQPHDTAASGLTAYNSLSQVVEEFLGAEEHGKQPHPFDEKGKR